MRPALLLIAFALFAGAGCGAEIGDSCIVSTDCAQDGTRFCDISSNGGYCSIAGCDYGTCPDESVCVRFFTGSFANKTCTPATEDCVVRTCPIVNGAPAAADGCSVGTCPHATDYTTETPPTNECTDDELCELDGHCVARASEVRYCMRKCDPKGSDCRDGYECRDEATMKKDGGEPVPPPDQALGDNPQPFCAQAPPTF